MKIKDRKYTTKNGLEDLARLMKSFGDFDADLHTVTSDGDFHCVVDIGGDTETVFSDKAEFCIKNGKFMLRAWTDYFGYDPVAVRIDGWTRNIQSIIKIDFAGAVKGIETVLKKYNASCAEKDEEIKEFLDFCSKFREQA